MVDLSRLNPQQREAVETVEGPLLLLAGAGTGKTGVITFRMAYLIAQGISPKSILAVTFTNKAAAEMQERIAKLVSKRAANAITIGTFHSFCLGVLKKHIHRLGYSSKFTIVTDNYQLSLIRSLMSELGCYGHGRDPQEFLSTISNAKSAIIDPDYVSQMDVPFASDVADVYELYIKRMQQMDIVDFDDLLLLVHKLWEQNPDILEQYQERYKFLLIDEYQDTNGIQFTLMRKLAGNRNNICVVGDDDQSIYAWRGADVTNILQFDRHFPGAKVIRLEQNYRSTGNILTAANHVIGNNSERHAKRLWSKQKDGKDVLVVRTENERKEARFAVELIKNRLSEYDNNYSKFAILFRSNNQAKTLEYSLREAGIPYTIVGTSSFYHRKEVIDAISFLMAVHNPFDDMNYLRIINILPLGIGDKTIQYLREMREQTEKPISEILADPLWQGSVRSHKCVESTVEFLQIINDYRNVFKDDNTNLAEAILDFYKDIGYWDAFGRMYKPKTDALQRRENVREFIKGAKTFHERFGVEGNLEAFLRTFALMDIQDKKENSDEQERGVCLMTVHASKGLEFPFVHIVGMEQGSFPHSRSVEEGNIQEERRLFYVALTRAQEEVVLSHCTKRRSKGQDMRRRPSCFLDELPEDLTTFKDHRNAFEKATEEEVSDYFAQMKAMFSK